MDLGAIDVLTCRPPTSPECEDLDWLPWCRELERSPTGTDRPTANGEGAAV